MTMLDVAVRWERLQEDNPALRLYALVDGLRYQTQLDKRLTSTDRLISLFADTPDAPLAYAGPWLFDASSGDKEMLAEFILLERSVPSVTWLITVQDLRGLAQMLQLQLDVALPDGRTALLRFWDPRVLANLARTLDSEQRAEFFGRIDEWHLLHEGERVRIGRRYAQA
jgi:hypothetical protein